MLPVFYSASLYDGCILLHLPLGWLCSIPLPSMLAVFYFTISNLVVFYLYDGCVLLHFPLGWLSSTLLPSVIAVFYSTSLCDSCVLLHFPL
jgi:hypothetical protein